MVEEGAKTYAPLMAVTLAGVESGRAEFINQISIIDEILHPRGWNWNGALIIVNLPDAVAYIYQAVHGAMCLETNQLALALRLARAKIEKVPIQEAMPLYQISDIIGWPDSFNHTATVAWRFLETLPERWPWLNEIFGDGDEYRASLFAYYLALNVMELVEVVASGNESLIDDQGLQLEIPACFLAMDDQTKRKGYRLILSNPDAVKGIWRDRGIDDSVIDRLWSKWIGHVAKWLNKVYDYRFFGKITHKNLVADLK
jgi:hypothetical protein